MYKYIVFFITAFAGCECSDAFHTASMNAESPNTQKYHDTYMRNYNPLSNTNNPVYRDMTDQVLP